MVPQTQVVLADCYCPGAVRFDTYNLRGNECNWGVKLHDCMPIYLRESLLLPCMTMAEDLQPSPTPSELLCACEGPLPSLRCAPTAQYPQPRYNLRTSFKGFNSIATVVVGSASTKGSHGPTTYTIHRELLTSASPFFAAALNGTFTEGLDQTVRLPEEKPEVFEWFIWWLYTGCLTTPSALSPACNEAAPAMPDTSRWGLRLHNAGPGMSSSTRHSFHSPTTPYSPFPPSSPHWTITHSDGDLRNSHGSPKYFLLLDLYSLSDRLLSLALNNHILDTIARLSESTNSVPTPSDTWILYDSTMRDSAPTRRLILDLFAYKKTDKLLETHKDEWHPRFLRELVVKLKRPGIENLDRHALVPWKPDTWPYTKACEACRELIRPGGGGPSSSAVDAHVINSERCEVCERAFCGSCVRALCQPPTYSEGGIEGSGGGGRGGTNERVLGSSFFQTRATTSFAAIGASGEIGACKPWLRGMCRRYHEHQ